MASAKMTKAARSLSSSSSSSLSSSLVRVPRSLKFNLGLIALALTLLLCSASAGAPSTAPLRVGVLADHDSTAWAAEKGCVGLINDHRKRIECNLEVYESAIESAAKEGVQMLVLPEGYGLGASSKPWGYFEPLNLSASIGVTPCTVMNATVNPQVTRMVRRMSCTRT